VALQASVGQFAPSATQPQSRSNPPVPSKASADSANRDGVKQEIA
jgi:hypothetical protein